MVVEIIRNGIKFYVHTAWANDTAGTDFSLTEYEEALFVGNYIDRSSAESNLPVKYTWKEIHKDDGENVSATEDGLTDYEERMSDLEASTRMNADDLTGTQQSTDSAIGNPNLLLNTNNGITNYSVTTGYSIEEVVDSIGEDTEYIKCVKITCNTPSTSGMLFFNADSLRDVLDSAVDENTYTLSMHTKMSQLFDIDVLAVQNSNGDKKQLVYDVLSNDPEDEDIILDDEWVFYESTTQYTEEAADNQMLCISLANMPKGAYLVIANLKIEAGAVATQWRESVEEVSREVKVIHEKIVITEAEVKKVSGDFADFKSGEFNTLKSDQAEFKEATIIDLRAVNAALTSVSGELASFKTGEFETLKAGVAEIEKAYIKAADVESIIADKGYFTEAEVENLVAGKGYITELQTETLLSGYAKITTLESEYVKANDLDATVGDFGFLKANSAKLTELFAEKVDVDMANITDAWVENLMVKGKFVTNDVNAATGSFTKWLTGVKIYGDLITAGTISTERLIIRDKDNNTGILYEINNGLVAQENLTAEELKRLTLDGKVITAESITADKINVTDLFAQEITATGIIKGATLKGAHIETIAGSIGGFNIGGSYIASANATQLGSTANSVYLGIDGISLGTDFKVTAAGKMTATGAEITGTLNRTKLTSDGMEILDVSGITVARYGTNIIDLGIAAADAVINLCGGVGNIRAVAHDDGKLNVLGINADILKLSATGAVGRISLNVARANEYSGYFMIAGTSSGAYASLSLSDDIGYHFGTDQFAVPVEISAPSLLVTGSIDTLTNLYVGGDIYGYNFYGITDRPKYNDADIALLSDVTAAAGGNYLPLSGGTMTDSIDMSIQGKGYYLRDTEGRFPGVLQNTSGNLWVGGASTASRHHLGKTFISAGYNAEESGGYGTIWIFVPNTSNNGGTSHQVLHEGNFGTWAAAAGHTHADYALITHTHSNYAASGHNHDDRYFTESEINTALNKKANDYSIEIYNGTGGNPKPVRFMSVDYSTCGSENGVAVKVGLVSGHGNGSSYAFLEDAIIKVRYDGIVEVENFKYYGADTGTYDGANRQYGDIFWVIDTTNKVVDFYVLMGQYARLQMTPAKRVTYSTGGTITQYNSCTVYSSGTKAWGNNSVIVLSRELSNYADIGHTHNYLPLSGGVMSGEIKIGQGDGNGIQLGTDGRINATVGTTTTATVSGVINNQYISGHTSLNLTLRGNATRPSYNGNQVALLSDINTIDLSGYLPLTGGLMTGSIRFQSSSLPQKSLKYICGIDAFADGGELGWQSKDEFLSGYSKDGHSHDDWYAGINHTHTEYSPAGHVHPEYAEKEHTHSAYAALNHDHGGTYAKVAAANTYNGEQKFQNSSYCPTVLDTASGVGCAFKASRGLVNELLVDDIIMTASSGEIAFYMYEATDGAGQMKILTKVASIDKTGLYKGTAEKATADGAGNAITTTYATKAQLSGYAAAGHSHNSITYQDTRSANQTPADLSAGLSVHLKSNGIDGISDGGNYHPVLALKPWGDISGGPYGQITMTQNGNLYWRVSTANNDTSWNGWQKAAPTIAPADISGTETITAKFGTSNGGAIIFGKEGPNSGTMIRIDQTDGTCRLRFRASDTAGAMVWEQPEQGAQLYIDLGKEGSDKHRITFPSSAGTLALTSHTHSYLPLSGGTLTGTLIAPVYKCDTTAAAIKPSDSNEINFGSNANYIYFGYQNRIGSDGAVANYYFGTHSGPDGAKSGNIYCGTLYEGNVALSDKYAVKGHTHSQYVSFSTCLDVSVAGATKLVYRYRPPDYDDDTGVSSGSAYFPEGIIMGGTAASAGLMARGICGISTPDPDSGACAKENLYINYDGDNTYRNTRHLILQAGSAGTHYGNNVYQYAAVRGDAMKAYCDATYAAKSHSHNDYLPLAGGVMPGNITIHNSNPYLCLMGAASGTAYVQTVEDTSGMQIGLGYGWAKSLKVDVNGNTTMVNDATINGDLTVNNTTDGATFLWIGSASRFHASGNYLYLYAGTGETAYRFGNGAPEVQVNGSYVKCSLEGHTHSGYVTTSGNAASATKASYPTGFSGNGGNITWGTLAGDTSTTTGYRTIARWDSPNGGSVAFADGPMNDGTRSGQTSMQIDGYFYQNEGRYMVLDTSNYSSYALPKSGGTLTGALTFANGTWNTVGDDVQIGDQNVAGTLCIKGTNGATAIQFTPYDSNAVTAKIVSNAVSSYGGLRVTGLKGGYHGILFGDDNTGLHIMSCDPHQGLYNQSTGRWAFYYNRTYDHVSIGGAATADSNYLLDVYGTTRIQGDLYATGTLHAESSIYEGGTLLSSKYASLATANTYNGEQKFQNSSYCPTVTDTASGVGCAFKASRGMANELLVDKLIMTATTGKIPFYKYTGTSSGAMTGLTEVASISSSGAFTTTGGAQITGRYTGSGDDEGLIVGFASNGYAGVCLGSASGKRSVFYLTSGGFPFWRYNDGSASYDITHPGKAGTIALTSDVEAAVAGSHTHSYLPLSGGTVSGTISTNALEVTGTRILCLPVYNNTVSYAANMYVGTNGGFGRANSTSSRTIKHDIRELTDDDLRAEKLYDLNVVQFKYNDGIITDTSDVRYGKTLPGFIIEDMDEKYPIAIDKPGQDVKEWSWNEKYLIPPILKLIQDQHKEDLRLDAELNNVKSELKSVSMKYNAALMKIAELEKRIDQLELAS